MLAQQHNVESRANPTHYLEQQSYYCHIVHIRQMALQGHACCKCELISDVVASALGPYNCISLSAASTTPRRQNFMPLSVTIPIHHVTGAQTLEAERQVWGPGKFESSMTNCAMCCCVTLNLLAPLGDFMSNELIGPAFFGPILK